MGLCKALVFWASLSAGEIVGLLKYTRDVLRELVVAVINAVLADVATKQDIQQLRQESNMLRQHVDNEINQLRMGINTNFRWTLGLIIGIYGTTVIPLMMKMAGII